MGGIRWPLIPITATVAVLLAGCASTAVAPSPEDRQVLAPTGKLRVGVYPGSPISMIRDPASGETKGVGYDLGRDLARHLGVPVDFVEFRRPAEILEALKIGQLDFTVTNATAVRAKDMDFTPPLVEIELGYLVLPGSTISTLADVDRPGIRVGVSQGGTSHRTLSREFKNATVVPAPTVKGAIEMLSLRKVDAFASNKAVLFEMSDQLPGSRVLDWRWGLEHLAIAIPKGRDQGMGYVRKFAEDAKAEGLVTRAVERAGLRGTVKPEPR
jgi:polar amino acid transport system substrate-binding protein